MGQLSDRGDRGGGGRRRIAREDCGSRGDCGNPRDESLSFNLRALSFLFRERVGIRVNFVSRMFVAYR